MFFKWVSSRRHKKLCEVCCVPPFLSVAHSLISRGMYFANVCSNTFVFPRLNKNQILLT